MRPRCGVGLSATRDHAAYASDLVESALSPSDLGNVLSMMKFGPERPRRCLDRISCWTPDLLLRLPGNFVALAARGKLADSRMLRFSPGGKKATEALLSRPA